jgi:hypothetical protein
MTLQTEWNAEPGHFSTFRGVDQAVLSWELSFVVTVGHRGPHPSLPRRRPTRRQLEVLRPYIAAGSGAAAVYELGSARRRSVSTCRRYIVGPAA